MKRKYSPPEILTKEQLEKKPTQRLVGIYKRARKWLDTLCPNETRKDFTNYKDLVKQMLSDRENV